VTTPDWTAIERLVTARQPVLATELGLEGSHDGELPPASLPRRRALARELRAAIAALAAGADASWSLDDRIDLELAESLLAAWEIEDDALRPLERNPAWSVGAAMASLYHLLLQRQRPAEAVAAALAGRLAAMPEFLRAAAAQLAEVPAVLLATARGDVAGAIEFCEHGVRASADKLPAVGAVGLGRHLARALAALREFGAVLERLPPGGDFALGRAAFEGALARVHRVPFDARALETFGVSLAEDLRRALAAGARCAVGHERWWEAVAAAGAAHPNAETLLTEYRRVLADARAFVAARDLVALDAAAPLDVLPTPPFARTNLPIAAYIPAPPFAAAGRAEFWVTPPDDGLLAVATAGRLRRHGFGRIVVACVHEAYPGHHVQFSAARAVQRQIRYFADTVVFQEGWAFYCEELMRRSGFVARYESAPFLELALLRDQLWRALRVVIDVGLHCDGMTTAEAVALLVDGHVLDEESAAADVMYYCGAPTQPMSYAVGRALVADTVERLAADPRHRHLPLGRLHDLLLAHGALPFGLLHQRLGLVAAAAG
jgi:uncharacterized protein (DUF885 family)